MRQLAVPVITGPLAFLCPHFKILTFSFNSLAKIVPDTTNLPPRHIKSKGVLTTSVRGSLPLLAASLALVRGATVLGRGHVGSSAGGLP